MEGEREREYGSERNPLSRVAKIRCTEKKKCERKVAAAVRGERSKKRIRATADTRKWSGSECNKK